MKKTFLFLCLLVMPFWATANESVKNAGFVPANIWYSKDPFFAGENIRVYTIIFNGSSYDISGTVEFLDNGKSFGTTNFALSGGGRVRDIWIDWKATEGEHVMTARIVKVEASLLGKPKQSVVLENTETGKSERVVDFDTDGDALGNNDDLDDDNDGVSDIDELRGGTDPLKKDTDGNGVSDKEELALIAQKNAKEQSDFANAVAQKTERALGVFESAKEAVPEPVKDSIVFGSNAVEVFRIGEGYYFRLAKEEQAKELSALKERKKSVVATSTLDEANSNLAHKVETPFAYVKLWIFTILEYFFFWKVLFYGAIFYVLYCLIRFAVTRTRGY